MINGIDKKNPVPERHRTNGIGSSEEEPLRIKEISASLSLNHLSTYEIVKKRKTHFLWSLT